MADKKKGMIIPKYPDPGQDVSGGPKVITYHDWQSKEIIAETKRDTASKVAESNKKDQNRVKTKYKAK